MQSWGVRQLRCREAACCRGQLNLAICDARGLKDRETKTGEDLWENNKEKQQLQTPW
jgi:hypothetical protein